MYEQGYLTKLLHKNTPTWIKCMRIKEVFWRQRYCYVFMLVSFSLVGSIHLTSSASLFGLRLFLEKPKTQEEIEEIRRKCFEPHWAINWDIDMYSHQGPPMYDMWERRRKYPQYYEGRYNNYKRDLDGVYKR